MDWSALIPWRKKEEAPLSVVPKRPARISAAAVARAKAPLAPKYPLMIPDIAPGVVPTGQKAAIAQDSNWSGGLPSGLGAYVYGDFAGFPGYPYLSTLSTRAEYRAMAQALSTEMTRMGIQLNSSETATDQTRQRVTELTQVIEDIDLMGTIQRAVEHDAYFGRAQLFIDIKGQDNYLNLPLKINPKTIAKGSFLRVMPVEAIWTTPKAYNANNPADPYFYKPSAWFMLGKEVHADRLMTIITRPVPDLLKPAYDFGGMSLSQLSEPYVNNWLRTRTAVGDLIDNFSTSVLATSMEQVLNGGDGEDVFQRAEFFTATRSNRGVMVVDKDREEFVKNDTSLSGLYELQAQAQEHMCSVSRMPAIILTGISPSGLNASSDGEIRCWYDWIKALQRAYWYHPLDKILKVIQLSMYGEIDKDIGWDFVSLYQMTPKEEAEIRTADANASTQYIASGVIDPDEQREKLARDPKSGYVGLDLNREITAPGDGEDEDKEDEDKD